MFSAVNLVNTMVGQASRLSCSVCFFWFGQAGRLTHFFTSWRKPMKNAFTIFIVLAVIAAFAPFAHPTDTPFTLEDRDRLIRLEAKLEVGFQQIDKRFEDMRNDMNKRFEDMRDDINKRFEQVDKRFEQTFTFLWMLTGIFTTLTLGVIGFAYWDRRTVIRKAKEETVAEIEGEGRVKDLINALRELSRSNGEVAKVLRQFHIL